MRRLVAGLGAAAVVALTVWPASAVSNATITDNAFSPNPIPVTVGDHVTWRHNGSNPHSVTADDGSFDSSPSCSLATTGSCMSNNQTFNSPTFSQAPGTIIQYYCRIHGSPTGGMRGSIVVQAAPTTTRATTTTTRPVTTTRAATTSSRATTSSTLTSTTETLALETSTTEESTSTTSGDVAITTDDGGGTSGLAVGGLVVAILAVLGGGGYAIYRLRAGGA